MLVASWIVCGFLYFQVHCYICNKFLGRNDSIVNNKYIIYSLIFAFLYSITMFFDFGAMKPYLVHLIVFILLQILYNEKILKTLACVLFLFLITCSSEIIYGYITIYALNIDIKNLLVNPFIYLFSNFLILAFELIFSKINALIRIIKYIVKWIDNNTNKVTILFMFLAFSILTFLTYNNFVKLFPAQILWLTNLFCIGVILFIFGYFKEKSNNNRIINEYDQLLNYVKRYEKVIEDKSKNQHEYKNQLVMLKGMINKSNKKAINYIDGLYDDSKEDNNIELLKKLKYLPSGGLKGLIYYKIEDMIDNGINVFVDISTELKYIKIDKKIEKNLKDISKAIGVYMDNAIEASINSEQKYIVLEVYLDNNEWVFSVSNTYSNKVNVCMVDHEGYTTKGDGKGYGLSLVKDIIEHNKDLRQEKELNGFYYTQRLYIKK